MAKRQQKGQAAMEFLMTYGWAILVVLVVIGALAYFGILNPSSFLPKRCILGSGLSCADSQLKADRTFSIVIVNSLANPIQITAVSLDDTKLQNIAGTCSVTGVPTAVILPGEQTAVLSGTCSGTSLTAGTRIKGKLTVAYTDVSTKFSHTQVGEAILDVE